MASGLNRVRDYWDSRSTREQGLLMTLGISFVVVMLLLVGLRINKGLEAIETRNADVRQALKALHNYRLIQNRHDDAPQITVTDPVKLETYLSGVAEEVGITIPSFNKVTPVTRDGYIEASTKIEIRKLTIQEFKSFVEKVESKSQLVVIRSLTIRRNFRDKERLDVNMLVSTYAKAKSESEPEEEAEES